MKRPEPKEMSPADCQATLTINLDQIIHNYKSCLTHAKGTQCAAMLKADAYGMGIEQVAPALYHHANCSVFFVANLMEAIRLRTSVKDAVIYVLNGFFAGQEKIFTDNGLRPVLNDLDQVKLWAEIKSDQRSACAIHFDTGINRLGLCPEDTEVLIHSPALVQKLDIALIMSHLACSDVPGHAMNPQQLQQFQKIKAHFPGIPASLANSGGILLGPDYLFDLVRPGLMLFGGNPQDGPMPENIKVPFTICGKILQIRPLKKGMCVGYGATWLAEKDCRIALVNVGYADGYLQMFNNCGEAFINGRKTPVIGRVSMDMIALDISAHAPDSIDIMMDVEIFGPHITLEMASKVSNLSQYEILTGVKERYRRIYIDQNDQNNNQSPSS